MKKVLIAVCSFFLFSAAVQAQSFDPADEMIALLESRKVVLQNDQKAEIESLAESTILNTHPTGGTTREADFKAAVESFKTAVRNDILTADQRQTFRDNK